MNRPPNRPSLLRIKLGFPGPSLNLWSPIACFKQQKTLSWIINIGTAKRSKTAVAHLHHAVRGLETGTPDSSFNLLTKWTANSNSKFFAEFFTCSWFVIALCNPFIEYRFTNPFGYCNLAAAFCIFDIRSYITLSRVAGRTTSAFVRHPPLARAAVLVSRSLTLSKPWSWHVTGVEGIYIAHQLLDLEGICKQNA